MNKRSILLVEDDESLGYILREYLEMHGFEATLTRDGEAGLQAFESGGFDLCLLDVMMPKKDGFALAADIRKLDQQVPIIFLTAKSLKVDKLKGFKIGADDYLVKPVDEEELIARIEAVLRRTQPESTKSNKEKYKIGLYRFDYANLSLSFNGTTQQLTQKEAEVLAELCRHEGHIVDRKDTLQRLWGHNDYFNRRSMDVFISRLRKYLAADPGVAIVNVHGKGFVLRIID